MTAGDSSNKRSCDSASDSSVGKKIRFSFDLGPTTESSPVKVVIGNGDIKTFYVHEHILCSHSEFFKNALSKNWKEASERVITLPDADHNSFQIYTKWLYTGRLYTSKEGDCNRMSSVTQKSQSYDREWTRLGKCYALGSFIQDLDFMDASIDGFIDKMIVFRCYPLRLANHLYPYTTIDSPHRKLAQDLVISVWDRQDFQELREYEAAPEFSQDVLEALSGRLDEGIKRQETRKFFEGKDLCQYHEHTIRGEECYKTRFMD